MARRLSVPDNFAVPRWFFASAEAHRLTPAEMVIFVAMCNLRGEDGIIRSPLRLIAEHSTIARSAVARALPELARRTFLVDLGTPAAKRPREYRIPDVAPLPPYALTNPTVRATRDGTGWIAVL